VYTFPLESDEMLCSDLNSPAIAPMRPKLPTGFPSRRVSTCTAPFGPSATYMKVCARSGENAISAVVPPASVWPSTKNSFTHLPSF
jgi:hypothetical protein